jgi:two-component system LytT family response regulator
MNRGARFSHYRMLERLGAGGMGEVWLAEDLTLGRRVAVKVLSAEYARDPQRLERFLTEARAASALSHPNIAYIHEIGECDGARYLAMEYVEGATLAETIGGRPVPAPRLMELGIQLAEALDAAHAKQIIHRDIKPANLIVTPRGHLKVLDFGLAKLTGPGAADADTLFLTTAGALIGTLPYMSPEQAQGLPVDHRTDVFSAGVVLYEMATGRLPFSGLTSQETLLQITGAQPEAIARFNYALPEGLERIIRKCLEKDPGRRYQSAAELLIDLRNLERDLAGPAPRAAAGALRVVIVDDEELARGLLREYLKATPGVAVVAECANGFEAVKAIAEHKPDLVFLDVQMPKLDGFEVLELIGREVPVIFVTAFDQYAMRAFDAHAVDYLLKPFALDRFQTALERARARLRASPAASSAPPPAELARAARPPEQYATRIVVKDGTRVHIIPAAKLDYAEAQDDYVALHSEKKTYLKQQPISALEASLDPAKFVRIHRSYLINLNRLTRLEPYSKDSKVAVLDSGAKLPVSRTGHARLKELLGTSD